MNHIKRVASFLLTLVIVFSLASTAFACNISLTPSTTVKLDNHEYNVYQIFTGDLTTDSSGKEVLSNLKYGSSYKDKTAGATVSAEDLAAIGTDSAASYAFAKNFINSASMGDPVAVLNKDNEWNTANIDDNAGNALNLPAGYYLIVDDDDITLGEGDAYSAHMVQITNDTAITLKAGAPTLDKNISNDDNSISGDISSNNKADNVSVGSKVQYTLTNTIPAEANYYDYYYYIINDKLSDGLTFDANSLDVTIGGTAVEEGADYHLYENQDGYSFQVALANAKAHAGETVVVTYWATLNENAVIGAITGNPNEAKLTYSNNPNFEYNGTQDTDKPGKPDGAKTVSLGTTPLVTTRTYTTAIKLIKVDKNGNSLTGAEFTITGENVKTVIVTTAETFTASANGTYWKLKTGHYTTLDPNASGDDTSAYVDTTTKYERTLTKNTQTKSSNVDIEATVDANGYLTFAGLGQGTYTITESATPAGYNTIEPITVTVDWTAPAADSNDCTWTATATVGGKDTTLSQNADKAFELTVVNQSGTVLPETGGIGTTIFYIVGGGLVLAAVVLLVAKKRMNSAE